MTQQQPARSAETLAAGDEVVALLRQAAAQARSNVERVDDPKAQALFETTAEVALGLITAHNHYQEGRDRAWR